MSKSAVIIGSGVAGLASAIRLQLLGFDVSVFEKNSFPGGKLSDFTLGDYHFDRGPSLFTQPENVLELFKLAGRNPKDYIQIEKLNEANRYFFEDGTIVHGYIDTQKFDEELVSKLGERKGNAVQYLSEAANLYQHVGLIFLDYPLQRLKTWFNKRILKALAVVKGKHLINTVDQVNKKSFASPKTQQIFNRFATYNGSNPYVAPAMLTMIPHLEHNEGAFYPKGGMISITNALFKLANELGVQFYFNEEVEEIVKAKDKVSAVQTDQRTITADVVVSNMDVYFTYQKLFKDNNKAFEISKQERSTSAIIFYWGIKKSFPQLDLHSIFFSENYQQEFDELFVKKVLPSDPTVYINITSKKDVTHAPSNGENWFVMINAPASQIINWEEAVLAAKINVLKKLTRMLNTDIAPLIEEEHIWHPGGIERDTASFLGSLYGSSSNDRMAAFFRHANESKDYKNLFFAGGTVHPGGGIPLCLKSARLVELLVKEQFAG
ncbi:phytoene desaturase [Chryseotalea sanaruensis]|uniref:Phytoene desaturase n=1 Tax=Chryseotalea sanaruensis TaxID=2482724 RepID=A0A401UDR3_9BACT|nr:1-hydroxycarotenoid 3,4-desaturase CrtD [Chryseotalea sanaruensis]GCC53013.1 phytoene desaturase [Chryseotalea sanaruensis]